MSVELNVIHVNYSIHVIIFDNLVEEEERKKSPSYFIQLAGEERKAKYEAETGEFEKYVSKIIFTVFTAFISKC